MTVPILPSRHLPTKKAENLQTATTEERKPKKRLLPVEIRTDRKVSDPKYVTKYVVDLAVEPVITEILIYADGNGVLRIP